MAVDRKNPADLVKYYTDLINEERGKLEESLRTIAEYADQLRRVSEDTVRRITSR